MPTFHYKALTPSGQTVTGSMDKTNRKQVVTALKADKYRPIHIYTSSKESSPKSQALTFDNTETPTPRKRLIRFKKNSSDKLALSFLKKVYPLHKSGMPIGDVLKNLSQRLNDPQLKNLALNIWREVREGRTLANAIRQSSDTFDPTAGHLIEAGEATGNLAPVLADIIAHIQERIELKKRIIAGLTYPTLLCTMALGVTALLLFYLMPKIENMMTSMGGEMSLPARILTTLSEIALTEGPFILIGIIASFVFLLQWRKTHKGRLVTDLWLLKTPALRGIILNIDICRSSSLLATLLGSGVNITEALKLTAKAVENVHLKNQFHAGRTLINDGASFASAFRKNRFFTDTDLDILSVGENTGSPVDSFKEIYAQHHEELGKQFNLLTALLATFALGFAFFLVLLIVLSIVMSVMDLSQNLIA